MRITRLSCGALLLCMIVSVCGTAMHISEEEMDDAIDEAQAIYKEDIVKNMKKYFQGEDNLDPHSACYKAQIFSGASKGAMEINKNATLAMLALKCLLKKNKIDYIKVKGDEDFKLVWSRKIKKLCDKVHTEDITCDPTAKYRTFDGTCNNLKHPLWGSAMMPQKRWLPPNYGDYIDSPRQSCAGCGTLPSARVVSNYVFRSNKKPPKNRERTMMLMEWGQFCSHDISKTPISRGEFGAAINCCGKKGIVDDRPECYPIRIPKNDPYFHKFGRRCMNFVRSLAATDHCGLEHREQLNELTSFVDASHVYGSNRAQAKMLRTENGRGALLKTGDNDLLPEGSSTTCNLQNKKDHCLRAGDGRVNETPALGAIHTLFMREHNRIATTLGNLNKHWSKETIFQETRKIISAFMQHITYNEYLPAFLSDETMQKHKLLSKQKGYDDVYDPSVDPTVMNVFSTAAFRQGHSQVEDYQAMMKKKNYRFSHKRNIQDTFMDPNMVHTDVNGLCLWLIGDQTSLADRFFVKGVRNHLFEDKPGDGLDLAATNIQRGRDHGLPGYNDWRVKCKLAIFCGCIGRFASDLVEIPENPFSHVAARFRRVDDIDLYAGAMAEKHLKDSFLGPTFTCIMAEQFRNLKFGDRFWYETSDRNIGFTMAQLAEIKKITLSRIVCSCMDVDEIQPDCFRVPNSGSNRRIACEDIPDVDLNKWKE